MPSAPPWNIFDSKYPIRIIVRTPASVAADGTMTPASYAAPVDISGHVSYQARTQTQYTGDVRQPPGRENVGEADLHTDSPLAVVGNLVQVYDTTTTYRTYRIEDI